MGKALRKQKTYGNYYPRVNTVEIDYQKVIKQRTKKQKKNLFALFFAFVLLVCYGIYVCPYNYKTFIEPLFVNRILNRKINLNTKKITLPTRDYIRNSYIVDNYILSSRAKKTKELTPIQMVGELTQTKNKLQALFKKYSKLEPSVFVWEYSSSSGIEINADNAYPSASIIKIPIAFELMRLIDDSSKTKRPITLEDRRLFTEEFRTLGSGDLQRTKADVLYSIDYLANIMITNSDNSATNMLLYEIGGMDGLNRSMRNIGLKTTSMRNWLPDLEGTNMITAREVSTLLYNIDNPKYIDSKSKAVLKEYLVNTKNTHLLKEKLPPGAIVFHKTGNIGTMLGDSGIIYTSNGKKYIVTILVKRPFNDLGAKYLIQDASLIIYNDISQLP